MSANEVKCSKCATDLASIDVQKEPKVPCPHCGATERTFAVHLEAHARLLSMLGWKHKRPGFKRPIAEGLQGTRMGHDGVIVRIRRFIDRISHRYREQVITEDGQVMVDKDEDLRQHR